MSTNLKTTKKSVTFSLAVLFLSCLLLSGCAAALIAGGVAGGYVLAQHVKIK
jgi:hypothetical protein